MLSERWNRKIGSRSQNNIRQPLLATNGDIRASERAISSLVLTDVADVLIRTHPDFHNTQPSKTHGLSSRNYDRHIHRHLRGDCRTIAAQGIVVHSIGFRIRTGKMSRALSAMGWTRGWLLSRLPDRDLEMSRLALEKFAAAEFADEFSIARCDLPADGDDVWPSLDFHSFE